MARVLLVDDELHILRAAEFKLKRNGYEVICAFDGAEAWEKLLTNPPDVVVTDMQMPRMNGLQLIERLRSRPEFADLPVVMVTCRGFELSRDDAVSELKVFEIVAKPFSPRDLCRCVAAALSNAQRRRAESPVEVE